MSNTAKVFIGALLGHLFCAACGMGLLLAFPGFLRTLGVAIPFGVAVILGGVGAILGAVICMVGALQSHDEDLRRHPRSMALSGLLVIGGIVAAMVVLLGSAH